MTGPCAACLRAAEHRHHLEGRDEAGAYSSPGLVLHVCRRCHNRLHTMRQHAGVEGYADPLALRVGRIGHDLVLLGAGDRDEVTLPAATAALLGQRLGAAALELEERRRG